MDRTTLGRTMLPLERDGLIAIKDGILDRRSKELAVTKAGTERLQRAKLWVEAQKEFGAVRRQTSGRSARPSGRSRFVRARKGRLRVRPATPADSSEALTVRYLEVRTERQEVVPDEYNAESCQAHRRI